MTAFKSTAAEEETISTEDESWSDTSELEMMVLQCKIFVILLFFKCWNFVCSLCLLGYVFSCVVHMLQPVVHMVQKGIRNSRNSNKAKSVVSFFCKSSFATQKSLEQYNLVIKDCPTCCSSTYNMIPRLLQLKDKLSMIGSDCLITIEWQKYASLACSAFSLIWRDFFFLFSPENYREEQWIFLYFLVCIYLFWTNSVVAFVLTAQI